MKKSIMTLVDMPFCIGVFETPHNPDGLPDTFPLSVGVDPELLAIRQLDREGLSALLEISYKLGAEMGTPLSDSAQGFGYAEDFLNVINQHVSGSGRALEIGAGVGYISYKLKQQGWSVDSIEPGEGYESHWLRYGLDVINDFFPSDRATGSYDLIVSYAVLEHISEPEKFLNNIASQLATNGVVLLAVPDCTAELMCGDPGMLIHEHYYYYTSDSFQRCLSRAGFGASVFPAGYGRLLYAVARINESVEVKSDVWELSALVDYPRRCESFVKLARQRIMDALVRGSVGIFCPARALAILPQIEGMRFFDDSPTLQGKYYPPFTAPVESREMLLKNPPVELWIMSRTFGRRLRDELLPVLSQTNIFLIEDLEG